ncbi:MAG: hypothetical protein AB7O88_17970 [Reyranellaceae bacterium]
MMMKGRIWAASLLGVLVAGTAGAQSSMMPSGYPEFRDPVTGKVWTPQNVGKDGTPVPFDDRAFEPRAQSAGVGGVVVQEVRPRVLGTVPITSGPNTNVPTMNMDVSSLFADPGHRWMAVMYLTNNSPMAIEPAVDCNFTNGGQVVMATRVKTGPIGPGERVGAFVRGPRTDLYVDRTNCHIVMPG